MSLFIMFIRTAFFYFFIVLIYRIMGKREVGQLGIIDLIVSILIAELVSIAVEDTSLSIFYSIVPIVTLTILQIILANISLKKPSIRKFIDGDPSVIIKDGKINYKEMIKQKYNLEEIEYAILETNGTLSVFEYNNKRSPFPLPLILDGKVREDTLTYLKKDDKWIDLILKKRNLNLEEIFYAFYKDKNIFIIKNSDLL